jgi:hypothetical protein
VKLLSTIALFFFSFVAVAQQDSAFLLLRSYNGDIVNASLDNLDNLYVVSSTGQLKKLNNHGDSVAVFNGMRAFGKLQAIDVTNPLRPLLFYKDFSTIVVLDRFFANRSSIDLRRHNILQPSAIGLSYDNNIWVFDQYDNKLKKIDESGNKLLETPDFRQLFDKSISPQKIISDDGLVYLADSAQGVFVFDNYGTFKRRIEVKNWRNIDVWNGRLVRLNGNAIVVYNPATFVEQQQLFPAHFTPYRHSFTTRNQLVTFSPDTLRIYRFGN